MKTPLEDIKVLDLSRYISGPYCGMLLGDLGADVIKVEKLIRGDDSRVLTPQINGQSIYHFVMNRNKRGISMDFRHPDGRKTLFELAKNADIIVQNFRPGTLEKMGIGYEQLKDVNPGIIIIDISGFGKNGPYAGRSGFDTTAQAMSGLMSITGQEDGPPTMVGTFITDYVAAAYATIAALSALHVREKTGKGQNVEVTLLEAGASVTLTAIPEKLVLGKTMHRVGSRDRYSAPADVFETKDGQWVVITAGQDAHFGRFVKVAHLEYLLEDPRFSSHAARLEHWREIEPIVAEWIKSVTCEEVTNSLNEAGVNCAKVESIDDLVENPQLKYRKKIINVNHPVTGPVPMFGFPFEFSDMELQVKYAAPTLGEHNEEILEDWLGMSSEGIEELRSRGVIK